MLEYIDKIIDDFDKAYTIGIGTKSSAAPSIIFKVDEDCKKTYYQASCGVSSPGGENIIF